MRNMNRRANRMVARRGGIRLRPAELSFRAQEGSGPDEPSAPRLWRSSAGPSHRTRYPTCDYQYDDIGNRLASSEHDAVGCAEVEKGMPHHSCSANGVAWASWQGRSLSIYSEAYTGGSDPSGATLLEPEAKGLRERQWRKET